MINIKHTNSLQIIEKIINDDGSETVITNKVINHPKGPIKETEFQQFIIGINTQLAVCSKYYSYTILFEIIKNPDNPDESLSIRYKFNRIIKNPTEGPQPSIILLNNISGNRLFGINTGDGIPLSEVDEYMWEGKLLFVNLIQFWEVSQNLIQHEFLHALGFCHTHQIHAKNPIRPSKFKNFEINTEVDVNTDAITGNPLNWLNDNDFVVYKRGFINQIINDGPTPKVIINKKPNHIYLLSGFIIGLFLSLLIIVIIPDKKIK